MKKIFLTIQIIVCVLCVCFILSFAFVKTTKGITNKYLFYQITTSSMQSNKTNYEIDTINVSDVIVVKRNIDDDYYNNLEIGDVISFEMAIGEFSGLVITHRITLIEEINDVYYITTKGDNSSSVEVLDSSVDKIYGTVVLASTNLGIIYNFCTNIFVLCSLIVLPCVILIVIEMKKIKKIIKTERIK